MSLHHRPGDLRFLRQATRPVAALVARAGMVVVTGETTGHAHHLTAGTIHEAPDGTSYPDLAHTAQVVHEGHWPPTLDPGLWLVVRKSEHYSEVIRQVSY